MLVAFLGWYRDQVARRERLFYSMGMDNVMTLVMHGAVGEPTVSEWVDDHYIPLRRVLCDGVLCGRCLALGGDVHLKVAVIEILAVLFSGTAALAAGLALVAAHRRIASFATLGVRAAGSALGPCNWWHPCRL